MAEQESGAGERRRRVAELVLAGLHDIAGRDLYRANAFRVVGLPTDADRRAVRQRQRQVLPALEAGADVDLGHDLPVRLEDARTAFDRLLNDPHRRLIDEVLWLWGAEQERCGCSGRMHRDHDAAVRAHSEALDLEAKGGDLTDDELDRLEQLWEESARLWGKLLKRPAFWNHPRYRITALEERRLDESAIDVLRDELPLTLAAPLVELVVRSGEDREWLADRARNWPGLSPRFVDEQLEESAAHLYQSLRAVMNDHVQPALDAGESNRAAQLLYVRALPVLDELEERVPHKRHRRTENLRNEVGVAFNNCATVLIEAEGPGARGNGDRWLDEAEKLVSDPQTQETIRTNRAMLDEAVRVFEEIWERITELAGAGHVALAKRMLRDIRRQLGNAPGVSKLDALDRLLDTMSDGRGSVPSIDAVLPPAPPRKQYKPPPRKPTPPPPPTVIRERRGWGQRIADFLRGPASPGAALAELAVVVLLVVGGVWFWQSEQALAPPPTAQLFNELISDNAPPGACIETEQGWGGDKAKVPVVGCERPHWGEVLGYAPLTAVPAPWPGSDQLEGLARFKCGLMIAERGLPTDQYATTWVYSNLESWNDDGRNYQNYATCVVHRVDGQPMPQELLTDPAPPAVPDASVRMQLYGLRIWSNAPIGSCVRSKQDFDDSRDDVAIVPCDAPHWAEIIGYPVIYEPGTPWPGDSAVLDAADAACRKVAADEPLAPEYTYTYSWPGQGWWDYPDARIYLPCLAVRADGQQFSGAV